ncbi:hypothetical protein [Brevundimonas balnearis]|uniref:Uncharacterized protein n=1 Tax=Brevundimonas balnearis TaxID=1572858 RepID=A0ABV6R0Y0_9CAUL
MSRRKKRKPADPQAIAKARMEREASREMAAVIGAQPSTAINRDKHTGAMVSAQRVNCFVTLLKVGGPEAEAVNWFEMLVRRSRGEADRQVNDLGIRAANDSLPGGPSDAMLISADKLAVVRAFMPGNAYRMMLALVEPDAALLTRWRDHVALITGETSPMAQGARVRAAAEHLAWIHANFPMLERAYEARAKAA